MHHHIRGVQKNLRSGLDLDRLYTVNAVHKLMKRSRFSARDNYLVESVWVHRRRKGDDGSHTVDRVVCVRRLPIHRVPPNSK